MSANSTPECDVLPDGLRIAVWRNSNGLRHREGGPAVIHEYPDGKVEYQWLQHGKPCNPDGPTQINVRPHRNAHMTFENTEGEEHRLDGPAYVSVGAGRSHGEWEWRLSGRMHRDNGGPAYTRFAVDHGGEQTWWRNGDLHRLDGPALSIHRPVPGSEDTMGVEIGWFIEGEAVLSLDHHLEPDSTPIHVPNHPAPPKHR